MLEELKSEDVIHRGCGGEVKIKHIPSGLLDYIDWRCQKCKAEAHSSSWADLSIPKEEENKELSEAGKKLIKAMAEQIIKDEEKSKGVNDNLPECPNYGRWTNNNANKCECKNRKEIEYR